jgi:hypothetical protein
VGDDVVATGDCLTGDVLATGDCLTGDVLTGEDRGGNPFSSSSSTLIVTGPRALEREGEVPDTLIADGAEPGTLDDGAELIREGKALPIEDSARGLEREDELPDTRVVELDEPDRGEVVLEELREVVLEEAEDLP